MVRAPYPARIAAGLLVTAVEETRKLPTLVITLPMTAISQTLQAGMRVQQNIAELAIKGDAMLEMIFDKPSDQPEWAHFDEDDVPDPVDAPSPTIVEDGHPGTGADDPDGDKDPTRTPPGTGRFALYSATPQSVAVARDNGSGPEPVTDTAEAPGPTVSKSTAKKTATSTSTPENAAISKHAAAPKPATDTADSSVAESGDVPGAVIELDYDVLTLAQLRAKIRTLGLTDLEDLAAYERANKGRAPFITMLDNRISAKTK